VVKAIFIESNPTPIKVALAEAGIISSEEVRLPLSPLTPESRQVLLATLKAFEG
jgi:4-hydroxy-tetrahydrodipicolinate synthase